MGNRTVKTIISSADVRMGPITLKQPLPIADFDQIDPFLLLHHAGPITQVPHGKNAIDVGAHPHRGFEPITFIFKGEIHHQDSRGNDSIISAGGVQWMTAGMGIVHSESVPKQFTEKGGVLELIQLWVNLPAAKKMIQPRYQGFQKEAIPAFISDNKKARLNVISGEYHGLKGPVNSLTGITAYTLEMAAGGQINIQESVERNAILYQLNGDALINGQKSSDTRMTVFGNEGENIEVQAQSNSTFLYVSGIPIGEKVAKFGPYVMNTQTEIMEAMRDYQMGKMGILIGS